MTMFVSLHACDNGMSCARMLLLGVHKSMQTLGVLSMKHDQVPCLLEL